MLPVWCWHKPANQTAVRATALKHTHRQQKAAKCRLCNSAATPAVVHTMS